MIPAARATSSCRSIVAKKPRGYIGWGKSHQLGTGLGLAIGAKVGAPDKFCVNFMGDAAFGMTGLDFETAARCGIPITTIVLEQLDDGDRDARDGAVAREAPDARPRRQLRQHRAGPRRLERAGRRPRARSASAILRARRSERERPRRAARIHHQPGDRLLAPPRRRVTAFGKVVERPRTGTLDRPSHPSWPGLARPSTKNNSWIPGPSPGMTN